MLRIILYGILILVMIILIAVIVIVIKEKEKQEQELQEQEEQDIAFIAGFIKDDVKKSDKPTEAPITPITYNDDTAGLSPQDFISIFFPDPTENVTNALNFADSMKDTIDLSLYITDKISDSGLAYRARVLSREVLIPMFQKYVTSSREGIKQFSIFVSNKIKSGAKLGTSFFKLIKNSNMVVKSSKVARAIMLGKSISNYIKASKVFFKGQTLIFKAFLSRLGMKSSSYAIKLAERVASTKAAKASITTAKNMTSIASKTAKATVKTASVAAKTGMQIGGGILKALDAFFLPLLVFDIVNIVADLTDAGGYMNIGYKSTYDEYKKIILNELDQALSDRGLVYPFIYGPDIDQDEIFDEIQRRIEISFENNKDDVNDITYSMRKKIKEDLTSGILTYEDMMDNDTIIARYNMLIEHEKLFKEIYSTRCTNAKGKIVSINDQFSVYDKTAKKAKRIPIASDMYFRNSVQSCERLFSEISGKDSSYTGFSYKDYSIYDELIDMNKLNDDTFICIYEPTKFIYTKKTIESPLKIVDMSLEALQIFMNKIIQLNNGTFVGLSQYNLYTCDKFSSDSKWNQVTTNDKIRCICELNNGTFVIIKDDFLLYSKNSLTSSEPSVRISQVNIQLLSITKNKDGTFLVIGKDNIIYTLRDLNSTLVSTSKGSVIHGFQIKDGTYIFLGVDFQIYIKTDLSDLLLNPYENMDPNCNLIKNSSDLIFDDDTDIYVKNNKPIKKMDVCSFTKENCNAKWPIPDDDENYIYHEYKNNIAGGSCVLADSRMRSFCESDEVMINYNGIDKTNAYNMEEGSCLVNKNYCSKKGVSWNEEKKDCEISGWQQFWEFLTGSTFVRNINACNTTSDENNKKMKQQGKAVDITCSPDEIKDVYDASEFVDRRRGNYIEKGACYYKTCPTGYIERAPDLSTNNASFRRECIRNVIPYSGNFNGVTDPGSSVPYLNVDKKYSPLGLPVIVPSGCETGYEQHLSLCYINPDPNTKQFSSAGLYRDKCPNPSRDWWDPATETCYYYRSGFGYWLESEESRKRRCENANPGKICENLPWGAGYNFFPKCDNGYRNSYIDNNYCVADGYKSMGVTGVTYNKCPDDRELINGACYRKCPEGYERRGSDIFNLEYCVSSCPSIQQNNYTYQYDKDQNGQTINKNVGKTRKECENICNDTSDCKGIVSYTNSGDPNSKGDCYTVNGFSSTYTRTGSVIGTRNISGVEYMYRPDVEYGSFPINLGKNEDGTDKKKEKGKTRKECEDLCNYKNDCKGIVSYTTNSTDKGDCKLYSDISYVYNRKGSFAAEKLPVKYTYYNNSCQKPRVSLLKGNINDVGICPADFPYRVDETCGTSLSACFKDPKDIVD
jgi:hypothetical protein